MMTYDKPTMNELLQRFAPEYADESIKYNNMYAGVGRMLHDMRKNTLLASQVKPLVEALEEIYEGMECYCMNEYEALGRNPCGYCKAEQALQDAKQCMEVVE